MQRKKYVSVMLGICFKPKMLALAWIEALPKVLMGLAVLLNSKALLRDMWFYSTIGYKICYKINCIIGPPACHADIILIA